MFKGKDDKDKKEGKDSSRGKDNQPAKAAVEAPVLAQANSFDDDMIFDKSPLEENKDGNRLSHTQRNPANPAKPEPTEVNRDEYERIRIHLGAGANGD